MLATRHGITSTVLEADTVGGISRTVQRDGWRFDIGGHRFFTKVPAVEDLWHRILPDGDFLSRPRMSRIYYRGKLYDYPLKPMNALRNLGPVEEAASACSPTPRSGSVRRGTSRTSKDGSRPIRVATVSDLFKTYTEKVWGVDATDIQADWAAQRIKNLSLGSAIRNAVLPSGTRRRSRV